MMPKGKKKKQKDLRRKIPNGRVGEVNLKEIAQELTSNVWKKFARQIGVTDPEIQDIQVANRGDPEEQRYQMIRRWWEKSDSPDYSVLCHAAIGLQRPQLCEAFIRVARNSRTEPPSEVDSDINDEVMSYQPPNQPSGTEQYEPPPLREDSSSRSSASALDFSPNSRTNHTDIPLAGNQHTPSPVQHSQSYVANSSSRRGSLNNAFTLRRVHSEPNKDKVKRRHHTDNGVIALFRDETNTEDNSRSNVVSQAPETKLLRDKALKTFNVDNFMIRSLVTVAKRHRELSPMLVCILFLVQLMFSLALVFGNYHHQDHSPGKWLPCLLQVFLILLSALVFPGVLTFVFWHVTDRVNHVGDRGLAFMEEVVKDDNKDIIDSFLQLHARDDHNEGEKNLSDRVNVFRQNIERELQNMCIASVLQAAILCAFSLSHMSCEHNNRLILPHGQFVCFLLRALVQAFFGVMFSFFFRDMNLQYYIEAVIRQCYTLNGSESLILSAEGAKQCLNERWYRLDIFCKFATVMYFTLSVIGCCTGISLSYDPTPESPSYSYAWLTVIAVLVVGHLSTSAPYTMGMTRFVLPIMQFLVLLGVWSSGSHLEWTESINLLYLSLPVSYLTWYHISGIHHSWMSCTSAPSCCQISTKSKCCSHIGLLLLVLLTVGASLLPEYRHTGTLMQGGPTDAVQPEISLEQLQLLADKICKPRSKSVSCPRSTDWEKIIERHFSSDTPCAFLTSEDKNKVSALLSKFKSFYDQF